MIFGRDRARWDRLRERWADMLADKVPDGTSVTEALDDWPDRKRGPALAWIDAEIAAGRGPMKWTWWGWEGLLTDRDDVDPRAHLVDTVDTDHDEWTPAQVTRLVRFAPQVVTLALVECIVHGGYEALFAPGVAWTRLRELYFEEDGFGSPGLIERVATAPWLGQLAVLRLDELEPTDLDRLGAAAMPRLHTLELGISAGVTTAQVAALLDPAARPRLTSLRLYESEPPADAPVRAGVDVTYRD